MKIEEHREMNIKSLVDSLVVATGGNGEEIKKILLEHKVVHGFSAYRYMLNIKLILTEKTIEIDKKIRNLKSERLNSGLNEEQDQNQLNKMTQLLEKERGKREILSSTLATINYFYGTILSRLDKEEKFIEKIEETDYKEIGKVLRKKTEKVFK